jgi:hypothetical protein
VISLKDTRRVKGSHGRLTDNPDDGTAAAIGSIAYSLPPACSSVIIGGLTYRDCSGVWYAPRYSGSDVVYVDVGDPR